MSHEFRPAQSRQEVEEVLQLLYVAFPATSPTYFQRHQWNDPTLRTGDTYLALVDGRIVSAVQVFPRIMMVRGKPVAFVGIGNVGTHPDFRGRGLATDLTKLALGECAAEDFLLSMLFTKIPGYYTRLGYLSVNRNEFYIEPVPASLRGDREVFAIDRDLLEVMALYATFSANRTGTLQRDATYWRGQLNFSDDDQSRFTLLRRRGKLVAYARVVQLQDVLRVVEHAYIGGIGDVFALASALATEIHATRLRFSFTPEELFQATNPIPVNDVSEDEIMLLPLAPEKLRAQFSLWEERPAGVIENLFGAGELTYWQTDFF